MTTKLNKKLRYALETKDQIKTALQHKGADVSNETPFRSYPTLIEKLKTTSSSQKVLSSYHFKPGEKVMLQETQNNLPSSHQSMTGNAVGTFESHSDMEISFSIGNDIFCGFNSNYVFQYRYHPETKTIHPVQKKYTRLTTNLALANPIQKHLGSNYSFDIEKSDPFTGIDYPSGGQFSAIAPYWCSWDSNGEFLIHYNGLGGAMDILKYVLNEETNTYSFELIYSGSLPHQCRHASNSYYTAGDIHTTNTFSAGGKFIFKINKETNEISNINITDLSLPVSDADILLFGKNYLVLVSGINETTVVHFLKATPIDETLAQNDEGFYDNPTNYSYTLLHQEPAPNKPDQGLFYKADNVYSTILGQVDYYIHVGKEKIDDISDFSFQFQVRDDREVYCTFLDQNTCVSTSYRLLSTNYPTQTTCRLFKKEAPSMKFQEESLGYLSACICLNEYGYGYFYRDASPGIYKLYNHTIGPRIAYISFKHPYHLFMKNGFFQCGHADSYLYYLPNYDSIRFDGYFKGIIDEDYFSVSYSNSLYYLADTGENICLAGPSLPSGSTTNLFYRFENDIYLFNFIGNNEYNTTGLAYKITPDIENRSYSMDEGEPMTGSFYYSYSSSLPPFIRHKTKNLLLTTTKVFGVSKKPETNQFHLQELSYPDELVEAFMDQTPYSVQAFYDGETAFQLANGVTLLAFLDWDETSFKTTLKENTTIRKIEAPTSLHSEQYLYLSPFKTYQYLFVPNAPLHHCCYFDDKVREKYHLRTEANASSNWHESSLIGFAVDECQQDENGYLTQHIQFDPL